MRVAIYALLGPDLVPRAMPGLAASGPSRDWHIILQRRPFGRSVRMLFEKHLVGRLLTSVVVATLATSLAAQQSLPPQPASIEGAAAHVYKTVSGIELRLHVFSPGHGNSTAKPAVVFFFGGAWTSGTVTQFVPQARHLTDRGMVAVIADYRVFGRHQTSPFEAVADAKSAVRWLRTHAPEFGVDPSRIVASGGSSGGHIALSAATFDAFDEPGEDTKISSKPDALVLFNPAVDTSRETPPVLVQGLLAGVENCRRCTTSGAAFRRPSFCTARATRRCRTRTSNASAPNRGPWATTASSLGTRGRRTGSSIPAAAAHGTRTRSRRWMRS
jgi:acetyl esterase/lipase